MSPERWKQVEELFHAALAQTPEQRAAYLVRASSGDEQLRGEVERLLARSGSPDVRLERPAWEDASLTDEYTETRLTPGVKLGPYCIEAPLGAGGMGQVYKARDTRLGRHVAIKVVAEEFSNRFEREARAISGLNHPHICTLYDVGPGYLVMELVEGETLASRLKQNRLPMETVLRYGGEIADALAAAHAKGIVHRDVKPGNLMVTKSGIKVLDFGLARIQRPDETRTATHVIQGTPAYMAPEQLEGKPCDARTDIYALGLVLFEMATGKRLKQHETPNLDEFPEQVAHVVDRCLAKEPDDRWQSARDVKAELAWTVKGREAVRQTGKARRLWTAGALVAALLVAFWMTSFIRSRITTSTSESATKSAGGQLTRFSIKLSPAEHFPIDAGLPLVVAVEPRTGDVYYVASRGGVHRLYRRKRDELEAAAVPGSDGALMPFFSPDGQWAGFASAGELKKLALVGGPPVSLCPVRDPFGATWTPDKTIVFAPAWESGLMQVAATGGPAKPLTHVNNAEGEGSHWFPNLLPNGDVLFTVRARNGFRIEVVMGATGRRRVVTEGRNALHVPTGHLILARGETLFAAPFDLQTLALAAEPVPVLEGVRSDGSKTHFAVGRDGTLAYLPAANGRSRLVWVDRQGKARAALDESQPFYHPRLSPDGTRAVVQADGGIWVYDLIRGTRTRLAPRGSRPIWTPDGKDIFIASLEPTPGLYRVSADGSSESRFVMSPQASGAGIFPLAWSADGRLFAFSNPNNKTSRDVWVQPRGGAPTPFLATAIDERAAMFSPDGRWMAYALKRTGRDEEVWVQPYPGPGASVMISAGGGMEPVWSRDGREIFYRTLDGARMMVVDVRTSPAFSAGAPRVLFEGRYALSPGGYWSNYDVSKDGREFLMLERKQEVPENELIVVLNWFEELKRRVPVR